MKKKVDVFALSIYGLVIFPKVLGHINVETSTRSLYSGYEEQLDMPLYLY
ncbi:hypothetical protein Goari_017808 [Gossypium aridum]|uniref:Uncharacterized protein n=1 Tax=Gossypium aridum TaxID=34290 RepID=A0A7J8WMQ4_GOSAI|nr:hypothetical protein [Gossypium aridum]